MEPTSPSEHGSPEMGPIAPHTPEAPGMRSERAPETPPTPERPAPQEQKTGAGSGDMPPALPPAPLPQVPPPPHPTVFDDDDDMPTTAGDDDLIEKEWIDKAKKIISETKNDPHEQEKAFIRLQADYLRKRYGKVIKIPDGEQ